MRIYVPATLDELDAATVTSHGARWDLPARRVHAVTPALEATLADEDDEGREYAAFLAAADDSLALVAGGGALPARVVVSLDVPDGAVTPGAHPPAGEATAPSSVDAGPAPDARVVAVHVDEPEAAEDVRAVLAVADGDDDEALADAVQRVTDRDLLWYDPTEIGQIPRP
ncbi:hypothetical protein GCM10023216_07700 [Isoptericola chiayiensis]|uniref:Uncharacterized protein n=1 Tax=Isoptericola chiayiensis TaxID=579446 RepID=A0ABP8Y4I8_9MICO|nr:hypothetical protein [Isoptericola chiayiensis]NOV99269.1 hypothetical protein [Isoptericola chiayiensis]